MATKIIGYVVELTGSAQVRTAEGIIKVLNIGDTISDMDVLLTGPATTVQIVFYNGHSLHVSENTQVALDDSVYGEPNAYSDLQVDQLEELQLAILEGKDLSELEATAAGNTQDGSDGLHQAPVYERDGLEGDVDSRPTDFHTSTSDFGLDFEPFGEDGTGAAAAVISPVATIDVDTITADDIVNSIEAGSTINVMGTVGGDAAPGDSISLTVNGTDYTGSVAADNSYAVAVAGSDLASDTDFNVTVTGSLNGVPYSGTVTSTHTVDTTASATITVNSITTDDIVNAAEAVGTIIVTGSVGGDASPGDVVSFNVNSTPYSGTVAADNSFSIPVAGIDLAADTSFDATVVGSDTAGNPFTATVPSTYTVDTDSTVSISLEVIAADDVINAIESGNDLVIGGTVAGDAISGDAVVVTIGGIDYNTTVNPDNTTYNVSVPATAVGVLSSGIATATVSGEDSGGNPFSADVTRGYSVDTVSNATITVDAITADDIVNAVEAAGSILVTGTVGGDASIGDTVSFTVNGTDYSGTVASGNTY